jgi:hypothetical protein
MRLIVAFLVALIALRPSLAMARSPYFVDDGGITDKGKVQTAGWFSHSDKGEDQFFAAVIAQLADRLETTVEAGRDIGNGNDATSFTLQEKYQWHPPASDKDWFSSVGGNLL